MKKYFLNKKNGRKICDELWSKIIRLKFDNKCSICASLNEAQEPTLLNAHHLISRRSFKYRWNTENGILLCPKHHEFDLNLSAHTSPWSFEQWMQKNRRQQYEIWLINRNDLNYDWKINYDEIYYNLEKEYRNITGSFHMIKRISMYLLYQKKTEILSEKNKGEKIEDLAKKHDVSLAAMKKFICIENINK